MNHYDYLPQNLIDDLREFSDECLAMIDGGEECRGRDAKWSRMSDALARAADLLEKR